MPRVVWSLPVVSLLFLVGCSTAEAPGASLQDPELITGRSIYVDNCSSCHKADGSGSSAIPKLADGEVEANYPDSADQLLVIAKGRNGMPSFEKKLSQEELEAVVRYTREVLKQGS